MMQLTTAFFFCWGVGVLNCTKPCPCAVIANGGSACSWKVLEGKEKEVFGGQLSAMRRLLLCVL